MIKIILLIFLFIILFCNNIEGFTIDNTIYRLSTNINNIMYSDYKKVEKDITQNTDINSREYYFESPITNTVKTIDNENLNNDCDGAYREAAIDPFYKYPDYKTNNKLIHEDNIISKILSFNTSNEQTISNRAREYQQIF
jgi:hypothetical protein